MRSLSPIRIAARAARPACGALVLGVLLALGACDREPPPEEYAARVGDRYLAEADVADALRVLPAGLDSVVAREQVIEQWVTGELLALAARRANLEERPAVERRLQDSERAVLADAYIEALYDERQPVLDSTEIRSYYETNRDRLLLREPYVRVRYLRFGSADSAEAARADFVRAVRSSAPDSLWRRVAQRYADAPEVAIGLSEAYLPESQLRQRLPGVGSVFRQYAPGQIAPVLELGGQYHVFQVVDRAAAGTLPELDWIADELRRQMLIDARRQLVSREVQDLKSQAQAAGNLDIRR